MRIRKELGTDVAGMKFRPYKLQIVQRLLPRDKVARVEFCNRMLGVLDEDPGVLNSVLMRDEAHFLVSCFLINKICCIGHK